MCGQSAVHKPRTRKQVAGTLRSWAARSGAALSSSARGEAGLGVVVGLLAFLAFLLDALRKGWQCGARQDRLLSPLALGFAAGLAGHMVHMSVDVFRGRRLQQLLWLIAGLLTAMVRISKPRPTADPFSYIT